MKSTPKEKLDWLRANVGLWIQIDWKQRPRRRNDYSLLGVLRHEAVRSGLYSDKTGWREVEKSLLDHISLLRSVKKPEDLPSQFREQVS